MLYLFYGEEPFLIDEALTKLQDALGPPDLISLNTVEQEAAQVGFAELQTHCSTIAFLAPARLIVVNGLLSRFESGGGQGGGRRSRGRVSRGAPALSEWAALPEFVTQMPDTTHLVLVDGQINRRNPLLAALAPHAEARQFGKLRGAALEEWVRQQAKELEASLAPGAAQLLVQHASENLYVLSNELKKLALYAREAPITREDVVALVPQARESTIFQLIDHVAAGDVRRAEQDLYNLTTEGAAPPYLLFMLARQFRLLLQAKGLRQQGLATSALKAQLGIPSDYAFQKVLEQERGYTTDTLQRVMERLLEADIALKTGAQRGEVVLELLVLDLCRADRMAYQS